MVEEIKVQIQSIRDGLYEIIPKELFVNLDWRDLQKFIMGVPQVDSKLLYLIVSSQWSSTEHWVC